MSLHAAAVGGAGAVASASVVVVITAPSVRKCGHCKGTGHDRRNCPSLPKSVVAAAPPPLSREHIGAMSRVITGPARPTDPAAYWAKLGDDAGSWPFQRDARGALHLPQVCVGNGGHLAAHKALLSMSEYTWDATTFTFTRNCPCPGCH